MEAVIFRLAGFCFLLSVGLAHLTFVDDEDITNFLLLYETDIMIWKCGRVRMKGVQKYTFRANHSTQSVPALYIKCDVLGSVAAFNVDHNFRSIPINYNLTNKHYQLFAKLHQCGNNGFFTKWIIYDFEILDPSRRDNGLYRIRVRGPSGATRSEFVYINVARYRSRIRAIKSASAVHRVRPGAFWIHGDDWRRREAPTTAAGGGSGVGNERSMRGSGK